MDGGSFGGWGFPLLMLAGIVYLLIMHAASGKRERPETLSSSERLAGLAREKGGSEYDIFCLAASHWHVPDSRVDRDFKLYLTDEQIPYYVNGYIRHSAPEETR